jgi:Mg-chelatase subunit ChlD
MSNNDTGKALRLLDHAVSVIPKPLFFGVCGAVGCCVAAVLLGEPLWRLLEPPPRPLPPAPVARPALRVAASPSVLVDRGNTNRFEVRVARDDFDAPIIFKAVRPPAGVVLPDLVLAADQEVGAWDVQTREDAREGEHVVMFRAFAEGVDVASEGVITVTVREPPRPPPALRIAASPSVEVEQGKSNRFHVNVARDFFEGPVLLEAARTPHGVRLEPTTLPADTGTFTWEIAVTSEVPPGEYPLALRASHPVIREHDRPAVPPEATTTFVATDGPATVTEPRRARRDDDDRPRTTRDRKDAEKERTGNPRPEQLRADAEVTLVVHGPPRHRVDIMFVLDVTGSMSWAITGIRDGITTFVDELVKRDIDVRVGLVAFRDNSIGEKAAVLAFDDGDFTSDATRFRTEVAKLTANGGGDAPESSLDALVLAANRLTRADTTAVLLLVTDADPRQPDTEVVDIGDGVTRLKTAGIDQVHLVIDGDKRRTYAPLAEAFPGKHLDLREAAQSKRSFADTLPDFSKEIVRIAVASMPASRLEPATRPPMPPQAAAPAADPQRAAPAPLPPPAPAVKSVQSSQDFAGDSGAGLVLAVAVWTASLSAGVFLALLLAQNLYVARGWGETQKLVLGALGGMVAGGLGGAVSQLVFLVSGQSPGLEALGRIIGWTVLGTLVGVGMTRNVPNVRPLHGLLGGAVGGAIGALGFLALVTLCGAADQAGRLIGSLALGFSLGLLVAVAERAFRSAWLEVRQGRLETRQINLGTTAITFGSDCHQAIVYAAGAPPLAWRYWLEGSQCFREDCCSGRREQIFPGDEHTFANVTVTLKTSRGSSAAQRARVVPPPPPPPPRTPTSRPPSPMANTPIPNTPEASPLGRPAGRASPPPPPPPHRSAPPPPPPSLRRT